MVNTFYSTINRETLTLITLSKVQKILRNATRSENTFQSFNIEVYEKFYFSVEFLGCYAFLSLDLSAQLVIKKKIVFVLIYNC